MTDDEVEKIAELVAVRLEGAQRPTSECALTSEEQVAVKELIRTKKNAVRLFLYIFGALTLWAIKDIYIYIVSSISFK
ncbi:MAG: hypothetical protein IME98_04325 [Proteobacteria bacterium]|nr:hypothetical protein [Pseudomonadota bacterium]